jgi:hypothetical protein
MVAITNRIFVEGWIKISLLIDKDIKEIFMADTKFPVGRGVYRSGCHYLLILL